MTHLAMAFTIFHPGVTTALLGARTMTHLDDLLAGVNVRRCVVADQYADGHQATPEAMCSGRRACTDQP